MHKSSPTFRQEQQGYNRSQGLLVQLGPQEQAAHRGPQEQVARRGLRDCKENRGPQVRKAGAARKAIRAIRAHKAHKAHLAHRGLQEQGERAKGNNQRRTYQT